MAQIASVDYINELIYLHIDTVTAGFDPALMQQEYRALRRTVEDNRKFDPMVSFVGNEDKGGGNFTPPSTRLRAGVRIVPYDTPHSLDILNEILNVPDGLADRDVFDRSSVTSNVDIDPVYSPVEVRIVATGSGVLPSDIVAIKDAIYDEALLGSEDFRASMLRILERLDLDTAKPNVYANDGSTITGNDFTLTRTNDGTNTTVQRS